MRAAVVVSLGIALLLWWYATNRRHVARRERQTADWNGNNERPDLWTSAAACVHCGAAGGLLELAGESLQFQCLACGRRHVRENRG